jgi:hypothetical protein
MKETWGLRSFPLFLPFPAFDFLGRRMMKNILGVQKIGGLSNK